MYVHKGIMIFLGPSNSYYIICFFYCYKEDVFIELLIITPNFILLVEILLGSFPHLQFHSYIQYACLSLYVPVSL